MHNLQSEKFGGSAHWWSIVRLLGLVIIYWFGLGHFTASAKNQSFVSTQLLAQVQQNPGTDKPINKAPENGDTPTSEKKAEAKQEVFPPIRRDLGDLPFPVRRMRELILEAALSGDIEKLRPLIGYGDDVTMLSLGGIEEDPLNFLRSLSGDKEGHEILAILVEVLESGFVLTDEGTDQELYIWPYFFAWPLDKLEPTQKVELYRLVTHGDYEDMESFGAYIFYRLGITPRGRWRFFVAGD